MWYTESKIFIFILSDCSIIFNPFFAGGPTDLPVGDLALDGRFPCREAEFSIIAVT